MNDQLLKQLMRDEGVRHTPYLDTVGKLTVGVGRNITDVPFSDATILQMAQEDVDKAKMALRRRFPWTDGMDEVRRNALVAMTFNMGIGGLATFTNALYFTQRGEYGAAAQHFMESKWAQQVGKRANRLTAQLRTGWWDGVAPATKGVRDVTGPIVTGSLD